MSQSKNATSEVYLTLLVAFSTSNAIEFRTPETHCGISRTRKGCRTPSRARLISSEFLEWRSPHLNLVKKNPLRVQWTYADNTFLPLARREASTRRPFFVLIRARNP